MCVPRCVHLRNCARMLTAAMHCVVVATWCREGRDVFNEPPSKEDALLAVAAATALKAATLGTQAVIHTTKGDVFLRLLPDRAPKAVENFCGHAKAGYYNNLLFHRVIPGFMIQTGDPEGDGASRAAHASPRAFVRSA
ncbi:hypothetical protein EON66_04295 [archaeon]|nr:MAG: hypothetical protein EON66_04295 [archaeon]